MPRPSGPTKAGTDGPPLGLAGEYPTDVESSTVAAVQSALSYRQSMRFSSASSTTTSAAPAESTALHPVAPSPITIPGLAEADPPVTLQQRKDYVSKADDILGGRDNCISTRNSEAT